jgi:molybdate transport system substrate-binding protein
MKRNEEHKIFAWKALSLALVAMHLAACSDEPKVAAQAPVTPGSPPVELTIYAAASTRDALGALDTLFEADSKAKVVVNFGSSGDLSRQIIAAAKADVFLSADEKEMNRVGKESLLVSGSRRVLLSNQLVVIEPADAPTSLAKDFSPAVLASDSVKQLSLANVESVPAGRYAKAWLESKHAWEGVASKVLPAVDVRAALAAVEAGAAEAGIVYRTDAAHSTKVRVVFAVPTEDGPRVSYPVAAIAGRPNAALAKSYVDFLASDRARAIWEKEGFIVLEPSPAKKD